MTVNLGSQVSEVRLRALPNMIVVPNIIDIRCVHKGGRYVSDGSSCLKGNTQVKKEQYPLVGVL